MKKNKKWYQKVSSYFIILFFLIALIVLTVSITILIKAKKNPDDVPDFMGYKPMIVLSGSMEEEIYAGDLAIVKIIDPENLVVGDIIAFRVEEMTATTHRIVEIVESDGEMKFVTKGDNNNTNDEDLVSYSEVEGIYLFKISGFGNIFMFIQKPLGLVVTLLVIFALGMTGMYLNNRKKTKKELEEFKEYKKEKEKKSK